MTYGRLSNTAARTRPRAIFVLLLSLPKVLDLPRVLRQGVQHGLEGLRHVPKGEKLRHPSLPEPSCHSTVSPSRHSTFSR